MFTLIQRIPFKDNNRQTEEYIFESSDIKYFFTRDIINLSPDIIRLFINNSTKHDSDCLLDKKHVLRMKLDTGNINSQIKATVVLISGYNDLRIIDTFMNTIYIPVEIVLNSYSHYMAISSKCILNKTTPSKNEIWMLGRYSYEGEKNIRIKEIEYGIFIISNQTLKEKYSNFELVWNNIKLNKDHKKYLLCSKVSISAYHICFYKKKRITICSLVQNKHTYLPKTYLLCLKCKNGFLTIVYLSDFVKYYNLKVLKVANEKNLIYYDCNIFPTPEELNLLKKDFTR